MFASNCVDPPPPPPEAVTVRLIVVLWLNEPDTPVTVTVEVPVVAVLLAVNVTPLVLVAGFVPNAAVTPVGRPDADSVTLPVKPLVGMTVTVLEPVPPCTTLTLLGEADSEKLACAAATTVRLTVAVCVSVPDVPVMVTVAAPVVAVLLAVNVRTLVLVVLAGLNEAVTPDGKPDAVNATLPVKPLRSVTVTVLVPA